MKKPIPEVKCLDHGFVRLIDYMGNDKRIVDAARVSYQQGTTKVSSDRDLIRYLLRHLHTTPFEKVRFEFHVKAPIFVARQWMRHRMGSFNEVSARYSVMPDEFYVPDPVRKQSESNKQGSSDETVDEFKPTPTANPIDVRLYLKEVTFANAYKDYKALLEAGVARELARCVLPTSLYTEFYWTVDLWNLMHFLRLRIDSHAQKEIQVYGQAILQLVKEHCDLEYAMEAFQDYILDKPNISKYELEVLRSVISELDIDHGHVQAMINDRIENHPKMSKREKRESKLIELLFGETDAD